MRRLFALLLISLSLVLAPAIARATGVDTAGLSAKALDAQQRGDFATAVRLLTEAITSGQLPPPQLAVAYFNRGAARRKIGQLDDAIDDFDISIHLDPNFPPAYDSRGNAHREKGEIDKAIADYSTALRLAPSYANALDNRGNAYRDRGEPDKALADYDAALKLRPEDVVAHFNRAHVEMELERYDAAADDYRSVIALAPSNYYPVLLLHLALTRAGHDDALELERDALRLNRDIWPSPLLALFLGTASADEALAAAAKEDDAKEQHRCEADFYVGMHYLLNKGQPPAKGKQPMAKERSRAVKLLGDAARNCRPEFFERSAALLELKRLER